MSCEYFNDLSNSGALQTGEPSCSFESVCGKQIKNCAWASYIRGVDRRSRRRAITEDDVLQDKVLAILEAQNDSTVQSPRLES